MGRNLQTTILFLSILPMASFEAGADPKRAAAINEEVEQLAGSMNLWPGFEPLKIPLAVYTGEATYLFRHPAPPGGFVKGRYPGRHPAVTANSSAKIGGVVTATLLADEPPAGGTALPVGTLAAVALHEAFHVFQRARHPHWIGNEGDLFLYPFEDEEVLTLRRLETEAIRRALNSEEDGEAACWTRRALAARSERFEMMEEPFRLYERGNEWNEGLAEFIELTAAPRATVEVPEGGFAATDLRLRFYTVGPSLAFLLERFRPDWKSALEADDQQPLDALLASAVEAREPVGEEASPPCFFRTEETLVIAAQAREDAAAVARARVEERRAFDALPGGRVVIEATRDQPLWPQGFDPLNVQRVEGGVLHSRFLRLGNDAGEFTVVDGEGADLLALTEAAGEHPLFQGVRRVVIAGLGEIRVLETEGKVRLEAPGLTGEFAGARMVQRGDQVHLRLGSGRRAVPCRDCDPGASEEP